MPKIPTSQESVGISAPSVQNQRVSNVQLPGAVPGQFGQAVDQSNQRMANTIQGIAGDVIDIGKMNQAADEKRYLVKSAEIETKYLQSLQDLQYSQDSVTKKDDKGNDYQVAKGTKLRMGYNAKNSVNDLSDGAKSSMEELLKDLPDGYRKDMLRNQLKQHTLPVLNSQIEHDAGQLRTADKNTFDARKDTLINTVQSNKKSLEDTILNLSKNRADEQARFGFSNEESSNALHEDIAKVSLVAANSIIKSGGTVEEAISLIDSVGIKEKIDKKSYDDIENDLEIQYKKQAGLKDWATKQEKIQVNFDLSQGLVDGTLTPESLRLLQKSGKLDSETFAIFDTVLRKGDIGIPSSTELAKPEAFLKALHDSINNEKDVQQILKDVTTAYGKKEFGSNQYAYFVQEANKQFANERKGLNRLSPDMIEGRNQMKGVLDATDKLTPKEQAKIVTSYMEKIKNGEDKEKAKNSVLWDYAAKKNKYLNNIPSGGVKGHDRYGNAIIIYPDKRWEIIETKNKQENK